MTRLAARDRVGDGGASLLHELRWYLVHDFDVVLQLEAEVLDSRAHHQRALSLVRIVGDLRFRLRRVLANQVGRNLRALDGSARIAEAIGEVAQVACDSAPAP